MHPHTPSHTMRRMLKKTKRRPRFAMSSKGFACNSEEESLAKHYRESAVIEGCSKC